MSEETNAVPVLSLLDQLRIQHAQFIQKRDIAQANLNQLIGAVFACEVMIKKHETEDASKGLSQENLGDQGNGQADKQVSDANPV
jgi:hypothetical protein